MVSVITLALVCKVCSYPVGREYSLSETCWSFASQRLAKLWAISEALNGKSKQGREVS